MNGTEVRSLMPQHWYSPLLSLCEGSQIRFPFIHTYHSFVGGLQTAVHHAQLFSLALGFPVHSGLVLSGVQVRSHWRSFDSEASLLGS